MHATDMENGYPDPTFADEIQILVSAKKSYQNRLSQRIHHNSPDMLTKETGPSSQDQVEEIACYLWPGLLDVGGRLIRAGEVLCKIKGKR